MAKTQINKKDPKSKNLKNNRENIYKGDGYRCNINFYTSNVSLLFFFSMVVVGEIRLPFSLSYDFSPAQHTGGPHPPANNYLPKRGKNNIFIFFIFILLFQWKVWMMKLGGGEILRL